MNPLIDMDPLYQFPTHGIFKIRFLRKSMHDIRRFNINHLHQLVHSPASRAAQNFWDLIPQTQTWKLAQNVKVYQVSSPSEVVLPRLQSPEDILPTSKDGLWGSSSRL